MEGEYLGLRMYSVLYQKVNLSGYIVNVIPPCITLYPTVCRASVRHVRPPSSYGSMKSDGDEEEMEDDDEEEDSDSDSPLTGNAPLVPTAAPSG